MKLSAILILAACLSGCGGAAAHVTETRPDGTRLDYWILADHFLSDPELSELKTPQWSITGFKSRTDNAGVSAVVEGAVHAFLKP